jgi:hypothetical protein
LLKLINTENYNSRDNFQLSRLAAQAAVDCPESLASTGFQGSYMARASPQTTPTSCNRHSVSTGTIDNK